MTSYCIVCNKPWRRRPASRWSVIAYLRYLLQHLHTYGMKQKAVLAWWEDDDLAWWEEEPA
jgi:hypothetical protein